MSDKNEERERLARLRDRQLQVRDPQIKQKKLQGQISQKWQSQPHVGLWEMANNLSYKIKGGFAGGMLGIVVWVILSLTLTQAWVDIAGLLAIVILIILGVVIGHGFDAREELKDIIKRW